jgi:hypothetical protein
VIAAKINVVHANAPSCSRVAGFSVEPRPSHHRLTLKQFTELGKVHFSRSLRDEHDLSWLIHIPALHSKAAVAGEVSDLLIRKPLAEPDSEIPGGIAFMTTLIRKDRLDPGSLSVLVHHLPPRLLGGTASGSGDHDGIIGQALSLGDVLRHRTGT